MKIVSHAILLLQSIELLINNFIPQPDKSRLFISVSFFWLIFILKFILNDLSQNYH